MSNNQAPNGFTFVRNAVSAAPTYQRSEYQIAFGNANSFGKGDVVKSLNTGYIDMWTSGQTLGILDGLEYYDTAQNKKIFTNAWLSPSTALAGTVIAYVISDPDVLFQVQVGNSATNPAAYSQRGLNVAAGGNGTPNTSTGISVAYADYATIATTSTLPFRIVDVPQSLGGVPTTNCIIGNDSTSAYNLIYVQLNNCDSNSLTGV